MGSPGASWPGMVSATEALGSAVERAAGSGLLVALVLIAGCRSGARSVGMHCVVGSDLVVHGDDVYCSAMDGIHRGSARGGTDKLIVPYAQSDGIVTVS